MEHLTRKAPVLTVRVTPMMQAQLDTAAAVSKKSRAELVRQAVAEFLAHAALPAR